MFVVNYKILDGYDFRQSISENKSIGEMFDETLRRIKNDALLRGDGKIISHLDEYDFARYLTKRYGIGVRKYGNDRNLIQMDYRTPGDYPNRSGYYHTDRSYKN